jgi:hypothetical protein
MLILQRRPMQHELLEPHVRSRTQLHIQTYRYARFQRPFDRGLEVPAQRTRAVVCEKAEDICTDWLETFERGFGFDGEEEVEDAGGDEGDEIAAVVYDYVLGGLLVDVR